MTTTATLGPVAFRADVDPLPRCLLLAVLLHVWLALVVGTKPGPTEPGRGGYGSLSVTLRGPSGDGAAAAQPAWRDDGPLGQAPSSRHGGRLRSEPPPPDSGPGAQQLGRWKPQELPADASRPEEETQGSSGDGPQELAPKAVESLSSPAAPAPLPEPAPPTLPRDAVTADRPGRRVAIEAPTPTAAVALPPLPALPEPAEPEPRWRTLPTAPAAARPLVAREAAAAAALSAEVPAPLPPVALRRELSAPSLPRVSVQPEAAPPPARSDTAVAELPAPLPSAVLVRELSSERPARPAARPEAPLQAPRADAAAPALPAPLPPAVLTRELGGERAARAAAQPEAPLRAPRADATSLPAALPPAVLVRELADPPAARAAPRPEALPPAARADALPSPPAALPADASAARPEPLPAASTALPAPIATTVPAAAGPAQAPLTRGDPLAEPTPGPRASAGSPDAGARVGHDVATAPSASASAPLAPLNLSLPRSGPTLMRRGPGLLELVQAPPERKTKLEKAIDDASRDDCRKAHGDKGLLAALPLAADAVRDKGCKW